MLNHIRVVENGTFITGPCAGMMLADLGADVVKIETPGTGDPFRSFHGGLYSPHYQAYNRNKRSVAFDLKSPADRALVDKLIVEADVFIQNFRPGVADRLGVGYERLKQLNPKLIYCAISGFGPDGPYVERPSYDSVAQALSGFLSVAVDPERPRFLGPPIADAMTGIYAAYGILGALVARQHTGVGRLVEISMLEAMMHFAVEPYSHYFALGVVPDSSGRPSVAQAYILKSQDGKFVAIHLSSMERFWVNLTDALEAGALREDPRFHERFARIENYQALNVELNRYFGARTFDEWMQRFEKADIPFAPLHTLDAAEADPQVQHLGMIVPIEHRSEGATRAIRPAVAFDGARATSVEAPPTLDQHGADIRAALAAGRWPARDKTAAAD